MTWRFKTSYANWLICVWWSATRYRLRNKKNSRTGTGLKICTYSADPYRLTSRPRPMHYDGQQSGNQHHPGNNSQCSAVTAGDLAHPGNQQGPEQTGEPPGRQHEAIDRTDRFRSEVVGGESRHRSEAAAVAGEYDERQTGQDRELMLRRQEKEQRRLEQKHDQEDIPTAHRV